MTETLHARTSAELADVAARVVAADAVAFDTEFLWERTYRPVLCLVQVGIDGLEATVDPLARDDLGPLWEALVGGPTVVVHAGLHDFDILYRQAGRLPARVFDTQVAAGFLGHGDTTGYGSLTGAVLRRVVRGGEGYTDWSRRPLSGDQLDYALEDVRHLLPLWRMLSGELETRGRTAWAGEEIARRFEGTGAPPRPRRSWRPCAASIPGRPSWRPDPWPTRCGAPGVSRRPIGRGGRRPGLSATIPGWMPSPRCCREWCAPAPPTWISRSEEHTSEL